MSRKKGDTQQDDTQQSEHGFDVRWTARAVMDLRELAVSLRRQSPQTATAIRKRIVDAAAALRDFPRRGRVVPELKEYGIDLWRELIIAPNRLIYRIEGEIVYVDALFDARMDLEDLLLHRLLE